MDAFLFLKRLPAGSNDKASRKRGRQESRLGSDLPPVESWSTCIRPTHNSFLLRAILVRGGWMTATWKIRPLSSNPSHLGETVLRWTQSQWQHATGPRIGLHNHDSPRPVCRCIDSGACHSMQEKEDRWTGRVTWVWKEWDVLPIRRTLQRSTQSRNGRRLSWQTLGRESRIDRDLTRKVLVLLMSVAGLADRRFTSAPAVQRRLPVRQPPSFIIP